MYEAHEHSEKSRRWFEASADEQFFFCRFTQIAVLRLLTTERVMGANTRGMDAAWKLWDETTADSRISFLDEPALVGETFRLLSQLPSATPKVWADAYLLAFASVAGLKLVTFDRALKARGSEVLVL